jgi:hypothetical protein
MIFLRKIAEISRSTGSGEKIPASREATDRTGPFLQPNLGGMAEGATDSRSG